MTGVFVSACVGPQLKATTQASVFNLKSEDIAQGGLAFITSSSVTGQEEDRQALAMSFTEVMKTLRPNLRVVPLATTLSAINHAGLAVDYKRMLEDYRVTGIFEHKVLQEVARVSGARYVAQLKLSGFRQDSKNRLGMIGIRFVETKSTDLRLFLQVWDSVDGSVVWEGAEELTSARDTVAEETVTFKSAIEEAARQLLKSFP